MKTPQPSLEWIITEKCNYQCPYCCSDGIAGHCSDDTIEAVFRLLPCIQGTWLVKLVGGEAMIHPRFLEICQRIIDEGHRLCMTTNFSMPLQKFEALIGICGDKLDYITASMHLDQLQSIDDFIDKASDFLTMKSASTGFTVTSVVTELNFDQLKNIENKLSECSVPFQYQIMKNRGKYTDYSPEIEKHISDKLINNTQTLRGKRLFGTYCHAGHLFLKINTDGEMVRCYSNQPNFHLGNISGSFKIFSEAKPCLARRCTCTVPVNRNMVRFGDKAGPAVIIREFASGILREIFCRLKRIRNHPTC